MQTADIKSPVQPHKYSEQYKRRYSTLSAYQSHGTKRNLFPILEKQHYAPVREQAHEFLLNNTECLVNERL